MPTALAAAKIPQLASYQTLLSKVRAAFLDGQEKIEQQKVLTYWQTGKHIHEHIHPHESREDHYGKDVIERLARDLALSTTLLYQSLQFFRTFKNLHARVNSSLTWAHYRAAMRIEDENKRLRLIEQAAKGEWTSRELEIEVRNHRWSERFSKKEDIPRLPFVSLGPFYLYQIIRPESIHSHATEPLVDFGFGSVFKARLFSGGPFPAGTLVTPGKAAWSLKKMAGANEESLYTFKAYVERVLDGDTLKLEFDFGTGGMKRETIRLNHIDCPELDTPEGQAAKRFVERELAPCEFITVKSVRTQKEKWGRYLGDVFYSKKEGDSLVYLNQLLLDKGYAVRVRM